MGDNNTACIVLFFVGAPLGAIIRKGGMGLPVVVAVFFFVAFVRAVKTGQYDDDYTPSVRMLFDDELVKKTNDKSIQITEQQPKP